MFAELEEINVRPGAFEFYTASDLWTDEHTSAQMLSYHLNEDLDMASRNLQFIDRSVEWISSRFNVGAQTRIADFGCGPGLYSARLARRGAKVTGIDFSKRSIDHAKDVASKEGLSITYVHQDYLQYETEDRFDLVLMIMCDFCALGPDRRQKLLGTFHEILKPGGSVLLDVCSLVGFDRRQETATYEENLLDGFWSADRYYGFLNTFKYDEEKVVLDKYTIVEKSRTKTIYNWLQCFSSEALTSEISSCGFAVEELYADVAGSAFDPQSTELAVVATRG